MRKTLTLAQPIGPAHRQRCSKNSGEGPAGRMRRDAEEAARTEASGTEGGPWATEIMGASASGRFGLSES